MKIALGKLYPAVTQPVQSAASEMKIYMTVEWKGSHVDRKHEYSNI